MERYLAETPMLDFSHPAIRRLVDQRGWRGLDEFERVKATCDFVRDEVLFGYNVDDAIPASRVLADGYGRCNTYIQSEGINRDFGVYDSPDALLREHHQEMSPVKAFVYRNLGRHLMNRNVAKVRG